MYGLSFFMVTFAVTGTSIIQVHCQTSAKTVAMYVHSVILAGNQLPEGYSPDGVGVIMFRLKPLVMRLLMVMAKFDWGLSVKAIVGCAVMMMFANHCLTVSKPAVIEATRLTV